MNVNRLAGALTDSGVIFQYLLVFWFTVVSDWSSKMPLNLFDWKYFISFCSCVQAEPPVNASTRDEFCILYNYTRAELCKGIISSLYVFGNQKTVDYGDVQTLNFQSYFFNFLEVSKECKPIMRDLLCRYHFPPCDTSLRTPRPRRICRRSCEYLDHVLCLKEMISIRIAAKKAPAFDHNMINCSTFDVANGGDASECYQYQPLSGLYLWIWKTRPQTKKANQQKPDFFLEVVFELIVHLQRELKIIKKVPPMLIFGRVLSWGITFV